MSVYLKTSNGLQRVSDMEVSGGSFLEVSSGAGFHNSIFRGSYLGDTVTAEQWVAIRDGTFDDLFIGDYWTIDGVNWRIADFDYWLNTGDTGYVCSDHHVVIVPDTTLYTARMKSTASSSGGYLSSEMYTTNLDNAKTTINGLFTDHVLSYRDRLVNSTNSGAPSGWAMTTCTIELMSETQLLGFRCWSGSANGFDLGVSNRQFSLFRLNGIMINILDSYWLRSVASTSSFTLMHNQGFTNRIDADAAHGVRPCFALYDPIPTP